MQHLSQCCHAAKTVCLVAENRLLASISNATDITYDAATLHGRIEVNATTSMPFLRFIHGKTEDLLQGKYTTSEPITPINGNVSLPLTGLESGTSYSYMLTADNGRVQQQSDILNFTTLTRSVPTMGDIRVLSQGPTSVIIGSNILSNGGEPILESGCIAKITDSAIEQRYNTTAFDADNGTMKTVIRNLEKEATYDMTAYASNKVGESQSQTIAVTLSNAFILDTPGRFADMIGEQRSALPSLIISGPMDGRDIKALRQITTLRDGDNTLSDIDITDVSIMSGGDSYYESSFTKDNVISQYMFISCNAIKSIKLPNNVTTIERDAFKNCTALTELTIPASVTSVLPSDGCTALKAINASPANGNYSSLDGVLFNAKATELLWVPLAKTGEFTVPATVTTIGKYAFKGSNITQLNLPNGLTTIAQAAFAGSNIQSIHLPNSLATLSTSLLQDCESLKTLYIGSATQMIGNYVFDNCPLTDIYVSATIPPVCSSNTFTSNGTDIRSNCTLHVPSSSIQTYMNHKDWKKFKDIVPL